MPASFELFPVRGRRLAGGRKCGGGVKKSERRVAPRQPVDKPVDVRLIEMTREIPLPARLVDVSASGVGLRTDGPVAPGKHVRIYLPGQADRPLVFRVVRCVELDGGEAFLVGAAFVRPTSPGPPRK